MLQLSEQTIDLFPETVASPTTEVADQADPEPPELQSATASKRSTRARRRSTSAAPSNETAPVAPGQSETDDDPPSEADNFPASLSAATDALVIEQVPVRLIDASPIHPRALVRDVAHQQLVESLLAHGQDQTISVYRDGARYQLRTGTRLWLAAQDAGLTAIRAEIHPQASRLDEVRRIAREDSMERPRSPYERALIAGIMRAALGEAIGRTPTIRELAPELGLKTGSTSERLRVHDSVTASVIERAGISLEEILSASHTALHEAAVKETLDERAAWLHKAVCGTFPMWWTPKPERPKPVVVVVARSRPDGGCEMDGLDPNQLTPEEARDVLGALEAYIESLRRRAGQAAA